MFFEKDLITFNILDVMELKQKSVDMRNVGRNFSALSFRFRADTYLKTDDAEYHMVDNSIAYVPARLNYRRSSETDELIAVHFEATNYQTKRIECLTPKSPEVVAKLFRKILEVWEKKESGYKYRCSALLFEIFAECHAQSFKSDKKKSKIQNSVDFILGNFKKNDLSISEIAKQSFMSEVYFRKLFKEEYGTSPQKFIINLRIQNAAGLISAGYYSLEEIAYMSGYRDYKYFSVEFKKIKGVSPSEYLYNFEK